MGYSNFKNLRQALERLDIEEIDVNLFPVIEPVQASELLLKVWILPK